MKQILFKRKLILKSYLELTSMEIDFQKFESYLIKKDKKNPDYRPLTSVPYNRPRNMSTLECIQNQSYGKKSQKIGYTVRMQSRQKKSPVFFQKLTKKRLKSDTLYDPQSFDEKVIKLKMTNDLGMKNLLLRRYNQGKSIDKIHIKQLLLGDKQQNNAYEDQNKDSKQFYQQKKLRVVKGKANSYKLKMKTFANNDTTLQRGTLDQSTTISVSIVGTRIL